MDKITLINYTFAENGRGVSTYAIRLYNELIKRGINAEKIATNDIVKNIRLGREFKNNLYFILKKRNIKNKNMHAIAPNVIPGKLLNLPKKKIVTVHDFYIFEDWYVNETIKKLSKINRVFYKKLIKKQRKDYYNIEKYDFVFARSENTQKRLIQNFGVDPKRIEISNDIIPDKFQPKIVEKANDKTVIGFINNFTENKSIKLKLFIERFKQYKNDLLEFRIYGKGFPFNNLIKDDLRIKYFGFLPEEKIVDTYNSFDIYLSTSTIEGFGTPIMQAKGCKIPVLCYNGDIPDLVKRNTILWDDENLEEIIKNKLWEKIDLDKAYNDVEECRVGNVVTKIIKRYEEIFI